MEKLCHFGVVSHEHRRWSKKTASLIKKRNITVHRRARRALRKKILNNLCELCVLCGEILLKSGAAGRKRNSGSYLNSFIVGQGASEASSLTNPFVWHHPQIFR